MVLFLHRLSEFLSTARPHTTVDLEAGVEQLFDCFVIQNRQAMRSMGRSMDWTLEDNMVNGLLLCATDTIRRRGHTPFV